MCGDRRRRMSVLSLTQKRGRHQGCCRSETKAPCRFPGDARTSERPAARLPSDVFVSGATTAGLRDRTTLAEFWGETATLCSGRHLLLVSGEAQRGARSDARAPGEEAGRYTPQVPGDIRLTRRSRACGLGKRTSGVTVSTCSQVMPRRAG